MPSWPPCPSTDPDAAPARFDTLAVHAGAEPDELTGAVSPPIYQTSTYAQDGVGRPRRRLRVRAVAEPDARAARAGGRRARGRARTGSRSPPGSAVTAALAELAGPGDEVVVGDDVYGGTFRYLERVRRGVGVDARYVDLAAGPDVLWEALSERTRLVWFETPSNPHLKVVDIAAVGATVAARARPRAGAAPLVVVDNTFATPALQRPLALGADIVFHSATKYLAGPLRTRSSAWRSPRTRRSPSGCASSRTRWGPCPGRSTASSCCAGCGRSTCGWSATGPTRPASRRSCASDRTWPTVHYPGFGGMVSFVPAAGGAHGRDAAERASAFAEATRASRSRSRSAASNRSSRSRRR